MFQLPCSILFDQQSKKDSPNIVEVKTFFLLIAGLLMLSYFSKPPTQLGMMIDDTVRLVCVHFVERKF